MILLVFVDIDCNNNDNWFPNNDVINGDGVCCNGNGLITCLRSLNVDSDGKLCGVENDVDHCPVDKMCGVMLLYAVFINGMWFGTLDGGLRGVLLLVAIGGGLYSLL